MPDLVKEVSSILAAIDFPFENLPPAWAARAPKVVLALARLKNGQRLSLAQFWGAPKATIIGSRALISFLNEHWGENISRGSYDEVRRRCVRYLVEAGVAAKDPDDPARAPNSPATGYALTPEFAVLLKAWATPQWDSELQEFARAHVSLRDRLRNERDRVSIPVFLPSGERLVLSPGAHNLLQAAVVADFLPQFVEKPEVIYIADALSRQLFKDETLMAEVGLFDLDHRLLPDVVVLDREREWLLIIEAVATSGHISAIRKIELERLLANCRFSPVFVSAFHNYRTFARFADDIAWETEVWVADHPTHMIHYNGERFLGPY